jgi:hypothetical protein
MNTLYDIEAEIERVNEQLSAEPAPARREALMRVLAKLRLSRASFASHQAHPAREVALDVPTPFGQIYR